MSDIVTEIMVRDMGKQRDRIAELEREVAELKGRQLTRNHLDALEKMLSEMLDEDCVGWTNTVAWILEETRSGIK